MVHNRLPKSRTFTLFCIYLLLFALLLSRFVYVQLFHPRDLGDTAQKQSELILRVPPYRGKILDRLGRELALDVERDSLGAHANAIFDVRPLASKLHEILGLDEEFLVDRLSRGKEFVWLARKMSPSQSAKVQALNRKDLEIRKEWKRIYPNQSTASHVIGVTGLDHHGLEGIEYLYDSYLKGVPGWKFTRKDAKRREVVARETDEVLPVDGFDLYLTLDIVIQHLAEEALREACKKYKAKGGVLVVLNPKNGDVLALANHPAYDPGRLSDYEKGDLRNRAVADLYEPGSVFKVVTLAAVLEEKVAKLEDEFYCERGAYRTGGRVLHDVHPYGKLTLEEVGDCGAINVLRRA